MGAREVSNQKAEARTNGKSSWAVGRVVLPSAGKSELSHCLGPGGSPAVGFCWKGLAPSKG